LGVSLDSPNTLIALTPTNCSQSGVDPNAQNVFLRTPFDEPIDEIEKCLHLAYLEIAKVNSDVHHEPLLNVSIKDVTEKEIQKVNLALKEERERRGSPELALSAYPSVMEDVRFTKEFANFVRPTSSPELPPEQGEPTQNDSELPPEKGEPTQNDDEVFQKGPNKRTRMKCPKPDHTRIIRPVGEDISLSEIIALSEHTGSS
jgi:hypothetical protein